MDNPYFYEEFDWAEISEARIRGKTRMFLNLIPSDVKKILDVGCGNGVITNELAKKFDITGVDRSNKALEYVKTKKVQCNCNELPFADNSFDLVLSSEMLEHLEEKVYHETIAEITRVAKNYILISVPHNEHLQRDHIKCPLCNHIYNMNYHLRSLGLTDLLNAFEGFGLIASTTGGARVKPSFKWLTQWKHKLAPADSWIPSYWTKKRSRKTMCPACNYSYVIPFKHHPVSFIYDVLTFLFSKSRNYWLIALFRKTDERK